MNAARANSLANIDRLVILIPLIMQTWLDDVELNVMESIVYAKFEKNDDLKSILLSAKENNLRKILKENENVL